MANFRRTAVKHGAEMFRVSTLVGPSSHLAESLLQRATTRPRRLDFLFRTPELYPDSRQDASASLAHVGSLISVLDRTAHRKLDVATLHQPRRHAWVRRRNMKQLTHPELRAILIFFFLVSTPYFSFCRPLHGWTIGNAPRQRCPWMPRAWNASHNATSRGPDRRGSCGPARVEGLDFGARQLETAFVHLQAHACIAAHSSVN